MDLAMLHARALEAGHEISAIDAQDRLSELVQLAEAGEDVVLTLDGLEKVRLSPVEPPVDMEARRRVIEEVRAAARERPELGVRAARSQDWLYDEDGLPA